MAWLASQPASATTSTIMWTSGPTASRTVRATARSRRSSLPEGDGQVVAPAALDVPVALGDEAAELTPDAVEVVRGEDGRGARREAVPPLAAQQPVERHARRPCPRCPRAPCRSALMPNVTRPAVAVPVRRVAQAAPDARDVAWVAAHDQRRQASLDDEGHREGRLLAARDRLAPAHEPVVGLDADEASARGSCRRCSAPDSERRTPRRGLLAWTLPRSRARPPRGRSAPTTRRFYPAGARARAAPS